MYNKIVLVEYTMNVKVTLSRKIEIRSLVSCCDHASLPVSWEGVLMVIQALENIRNLIRNLVSN